MDDSLSNYDKSSDDGKAETLVAVTQQCLKSIVAAVSLIVPSMTKLFRNGTDNDGTEDDVFPNLEDLGLDSPTSSSRGPHTKLAEVVITPDLFTTSISEDILLII